MKTFTYSEQLIQNEFDHTENKNSNSRSKNSFFFQDELIESKVVGDDDENDVFPDSVGDLLGIQVKSERNDFMVRTKSLEILISFFCSPLQAIDMKSFCSKL